MQRAFLHFPAADRPFYPRWPARGTRRASGQGTPRGGVAQGCGFPPGRARGTGGRRAGWAVLLTAAVLSFSGRARAQASAAGGEDASAIRVQPNEQIFATLCAVYAAGYPVAPANLPPQLQPVLQEVATLRGPSVAALQAFYRQHRLPTPAATLAQYVSFALVVGPPPDFDYVVPEEGIPPDVRDLEGFRKLLVDFYAQNDIRQLWIQVEPYYEAQAGQFRGSVSQIVSIATGYARRMERFQGARKFVVNVDPLIGAVTNFRIYSERYELAVNPAAAGAASEIRHAFLHFLLDPLPFDQQNVVDRIHYLEYYAREAPRLPDQYKYDFTAYVDECFVRGVEMHLEHLSPQQRDARLEQDDREGYLLVRPLYEGLEKYERSPVTLANYFPTLLASIDVKSEGQREAHVAFLPAPNEPVTPKEAEADQIARLLAEGGRDIATQQEREAIDIFQGVLKLDPKNTRAVYGLAVASALAGQGARSHQLFDQIIHAPAGVYVEPGVLAWSHVYLGRMDDLAGRRAQAVDHYRAALAVSGLPATARAAAESGVKQPYTPGQTDPGKRGKAQHP